MTANQIAMYQSQEQGRHNAAVEYETNRHNVKTEELEVSLQNLQAEKQEWDKTYQTWQQQWKQEYDTKYLEWQREQGQRKLDLEDELNRLKSREIENERVYKDRMANIGDRENEIKAMAQAEAERHNAEVESQNWYSMYSTAEHYKNQDANQQFANYSNYVLGLRNIGLQSRDVYTREQSLDWTRQYQGGLLSNDTSRTKAQNFRDYASSISTIGKTTYDIISGISSKTKKTAAESVAAGVADVAKKEFFSLFN